MFNKKDNLQKIFMMLCQYMMYIDESKLKAEEKAIVMEKLIPCIVSLSDAMDRHDESEARIFEINERTIREMENK